MVQTAKNIHRRHEHRLKLFAVFVFLGEGGREGINPNSLKLSEVFQTASQHGLNLGCS